MIIWDLNKFKLSEMVLVSFPVAVHLSSDEEGSLWVTSVYGPSNSILRKELWVELQDLFVLTYLKWCVGGDFNFIRNLEKMGVSRLTPSMRCFDEFIRESELIHSLLKNATFTWSNMQASLVCKRLNRFFFSNEWDQFFRQSLHETLPRWTLDCNPISLDTNSFKWGLTSFRFENMWLFHLDFKEKFTCWWQECRVDGWEGHKFMMKLKFVKSKLKE